MDIKKFSGFSRTLLKKYKFAVIILVVGLLLMAMPSVKTTKQPRTQKTVTENTAPSIDENLSALLSRVMGAGEVTVLLTTEEGEETVYQTNQNTDKTNDNDNSRTDTVTITDSDRNQQGLVRQIKAPIYRGAVIVCQGADSADVRLSLVDAVSKVTGLRADQISVLKMK